MSNYQIDSTRQNQIWQTLIKAYNTRNRYYHNLKHIEQILDQIESLKTLAQNFCDIQLAAWFHDVIYNSRRGDNEEKSAAYGKLALTRLNIPQTTIQRVEKMILATKTHQINSEEIDSKILLDSDLSILGADYNEYCVYAAAIRQEYAWVEEREYCQKRISVLETFLQRSRIYYTEEKFEQLEAQARLNLQLEIRVLSKHCYKYDPPNPP